MSYIRLGQVSAEIASYQEGISTPISPPSASTFTSKTGAYSLLCNSNTKVGIGFSQTNSIRAATHFMIPLFSTSHFPIAFTSRDVSSYSHALRADAANETLDLIVDGAEVDSVAFAEAGIVEGVWSHISMTFDGSGGMIYVWGNESRVFNYSGSISNSYVNGVWSGNFSFSQPMYIDNLYADEMSDEPYDDRPPRKHFFFKKPNAPGTYSDWTTVSETANWRAVDEIPHNSDTDYNKALSTGLIDTFDTTSVSIPDNDEDTVWIVRAVIPEAFVKRNDVSLDESARMVVYDGANYLYGDAHENIGPGYLQFWHRFEQQPDGSSWNEGDVNGMEYGYQSRGAYS